MMQRCHDTVFTVLWHYLNAQLVQSIERTFCLTEMTDVIVCGNPGVGKSALLSSITGATFPSGLSFGSGLTSACQTFRASDNVSYVDTPGLADVLRRENAAKEIASAFQQSLAHGHNVKIVFVFSLESGRIRTDDLLSLQQIMSSLRDSTGAPLGANQCAVVVNKCTPEIKKGVAKPLQALLEDPVFVGPYATNLLFLQPLDPSCVDADDATFNTQELEAWLHNDVPGVRLGTVMPIVATNHEEELTAFQAHCDQALQSLAENLKQEHSVARVRLLQEMVAILPFRTTCHVHVENDAPVS